jgi:hypothetical protein
VAGAADHGGADSQLVAALALFSDVMLPALEADAGGLASRDVSASSPFPVVPTMDGRKQPSFATPPSAVNDLADMHIMAAPSPSHANAAATAALPTVGALLTMLAQNGGDEHASAAGPAVGADAQLEAALALFCDVPLTDSQEDAVSAHEGDAVCDGLAHRAAPASALPGAQHSTGSGLALEAQPPSPQADPSPAAHVAVDLDAPSAPLLGALAATSAAASPADGAVSESTYRWDVLPFILAAIALSLWLTFLMLAPHLRARGDAV